MIIKDSYGFQHYEWSSHNWKRVENIWEFVDVHPDYEDFYKPKIGCKYVIYSKLRDVYELYEISEHSKAEQLKPFIKQGRVYILSLP